MSDDTTEETTGLLIEIQSCQGLLIADKTTSDPYVKIKLGKKDLHETKHVLKNLNPVFTEKEKNQYLLDIPKKELIDNGGLNFKIKDWDRFGGNDDIGTADIKSDTLLEVTAEQTMKLKITPPEKRSDEDAGYLNLLIRPATDDDCSKFGKPARKKLFGNMTFSPPKVPKPFAKARSAAPVPALFDEADIPTVHRDLFIEIQSCTGLIAADKTGFSDPYVKVKMGGTDLHETKHHNQTLNPIYDVETDSAFVLEKPAKEVFEAGGLEIKIKDWDRIGKNDDLGTVRVDAKTLYGPWDSKSKELKIQHPSGKEGDEAGTITIFVRDATDLDKQSLKKEKKGLMAKIMKGELFALAHCSLFGFNLAHLILTSLSLFALFN